MSCVICVRQGLGLVILWERSLYLQLSVSACGSPCVQKRGGLHPVPVASELLLGAAKHNESCCAAHTYHQAALCLVCALPGAGPTTCCRCRPLAAADVTLRCRGVADCRTMIALPEARTSSDQVIHAVPKPSGAAALLNSSRGPAIGRDLLLAAARPRQQQQRSHFARRLGVVR